MAKSWNSPMTYAIIICIVVAFVYVVQTGGQEILKSEYSNPDNASLEYIARVNGAEFNSTVNFGIDVNARNRTFIENAFNPSNESPANPKDQALEYLESKKNSRSFMSKVTAVYKWPDTLVNVLGGTTDNWGWILNIVAWFLIFAIGLTGYYVLRGNDPKQ